MKEVKEVQEVQEVQVDTSRVGFTPVPAQEWESKELEEVKGVKEMKGVNTPPPADAASLCAILREGKLVMKHGRRGRPHPRVLWCQGEFLCWGADMGEAAVSSAGQRMRKGVKGVKGRRIHRRCIVGISSGSVDGPHRGLSSVLRRTGKAGRSDRYLTLAIGSAPERKGQGGVGVGRAGGRRTLDLELESAAACGRLRRAVELWVKTPS